MAEIILSDKTKQNVNIRHGQENEQGQSKADTEEKDHSGLQRKKMGRPSQRLFGHGWRGLARHLSGGQEPNE